MATGTAERAGMREAVRPIAQRLENARERFIQCVAERGFTRDEAARILAVYLRLKAVKLCPIGGDFQLKHGALMDGDVLRRALSV